MGNMRITKDIEISDMWERFSTDNMVFLVPARGKSLYMKNAHHGYKIGREGSGDRRSKL
jgi:hypothetical protein